MSEFGKGFTYCIGLFLMHSEKKDLDDYCLWFNAAADHLYDIEIPTNFVLNEECHEWVDKCLEWRLSKYKKEDKQWAISQAKKFLIEWDKQCNIPTEKGEWE